MAKTIIVPLTKLEDVLIELIREADFDDLGKIAGELLGGECYWFGGDDDEFHFYPDENYNDAFGEIEK